MHPKHYIHACGKIEPIDFCRFFPFNFGNFVKYVLRAPYKGQELSDLNKALVYIKLAKDDLTKIKGFEEDLNRMGHLALCFDSPILYLAFESSDYEANFNHVIEMLEFETNLTEVK